MFNLISFLGGYIFFTGVLTIMFEGFTLFSIITMLVGIFAGGIGLWGNLNK
jgi:hypothetical protein